MLIVSKLHHIAIICSDYRKARDFYTRILGCTIIAEHYRPGRQSFKADLAIGGEYLIELFSFPNPPKRISYPEAAGLRHLALEVEDLDQALEWLEQNRVRHDGVRRDERTGKRFAFFYDPDDLPIECYEK